MLPHMHTCKVMPLNVITGSPPTKCLCKSQRKQKNTKLHDIRWNMELRTSMCHLANDATAEAEEDQQGKAERSEFIG